MGQANSSGVNDDDLSFLDVVGLIWKGIRARWTERALARADLAAFARHVVGRALWDSGQTADMLIDALARWEGVTPPDLIELLEMHRVTHICRPRFRQRYPNGLYGVVQRALRISLPAWEMWKAHHERRIEEREIRVPLLMDRLPVDWRALPPVQAFEMALEEASSADVANVQLAVTEAREGYRLVRSGAYVPPEREALAFGREVIGPHISVETVVLARAAGACEAARSILLEPDWPTYDEKRNGAFPPLLYGVVDGPYAFHAAVWAERERMRRASDGLRYLAPCRSAGGIDKRPEYAEIVKLVLTPMTPQVIRGIPIPQPDSPDGY